LLFEQDDLICHRPEPAPPVDDDDDDEDEDDRGSSGGNIDPDDDEGDFDDDDDDDEDETLWTAESLARLSTAILDYGCRAMRGRDGRS